MTVRVALVGCGRISVRHAELLTSQELPEAQLVAVCDVDVDKARLTGEKYGVPHYSSMDTMAQEVEVDLFSVGRLVRESGVVDDEVDLHLS